MNNSKGLFTGRLGVRLVFRRALTQKVAQGSEATQLFTKLVTSRQLRNEGPIQHMCLNPQMAASSQLQQSLGLPKVSTACQTGSTATPIDRRLMPLSKQRELGVAACLMPSKPEAFSSESKP